MIIFWCVVGWVFVLNNEKGALDIHVAT